MVDASIVLSKPAYFGNVYFRFEGLVCKINSLLLTSDPDYEWVVNESYALPSQLLRHDTELNFERKSPPLPAFPSGHRRPKRKEMG